MKNYYIKIVLSLIVVYANFSQEALSQSKDLTLTERCYVIPYKDSTCKFCCNKVKKEFKTDPVNFYYWYDNYAIKITQGSYEGKLLNGSYTAFYPDNNLKTKGNFRNGVFNGKWMRWDSQGYLREVATYKNGLLHGIVEEYDPKGYLILKKKYKNNIQDGKEYHYSSGKIESTICYKKGQIVAGEKDTKKQVEKSQEVKQKPKTKTKPVPAHK